MAVCFVPSCDRPSTTGGMCHGHYQRRWRGNFDDSPIGSHDPPLPPGLVEACTARLEAVGRGAYAEHIASVRLHLLIADLRSLSPPPL